MNIYKEKALQGQIYKDHTDGEQSIGVKIWIHADANGNSFYHSYEINRKTWRYPCCPNSNKRYFWQILPITGQEVLIAFKGMGAGHTNDISKLIINPEGFVCPLRSVCLFQPTIYGTQQQWIYMRGYYDISQ